MVALLLKRTRATLRKAEWGFLGVIVLTTVTTPFLKGLKVLTKRFLILLKLLRKAPDFNFERRTIRPFLIS